MDNFEKCFIMLCNKRTEDKCIGRNLFGDRKYRLEYLSEIQPGDIGFLLNTTTNELIGIFKAQSQAELDIEEDAWQGEFQAQVQVEPIGELERVGEASTVLAEAGVSLIDLKSGALAPILPVQSRAVADKLLACFARDK